MLAPAAGFPTLPLRTAARLALLLVLALLPTGCARIGLAAAPRVRPAPAAPPPAAPPPAIPELLDGIARSASLETHPLLAAERAEIFRAQLSGLRSIERIAPVLTRYALELLNSGSTEEAVRQLDRLEALFEKARPGRTPGERALLSGYRSWWRPRILRWQALARLRLGEEQNCLQHHNADSCLFPIRGGGVHTMPRGARAAKRILLRLLREYPDDLSARWLLNVAAMALGEYPRGVPARWRIPPSAFASEHDIRRFPNVARQAGLDASGLAGGSVVDDFDRDGDLDVVITGLGLREQMRFFRNEGNGSFLDHTAAAGLTGEVGGLNLVHADYDNDGWTDLFVLRGAWLREDGEIPNSLLRNNRNGTFTNVTREAGLLSFHPTQTAVWFDFNGDGWLDLFIGNETTTDSHPCELYRNNRNGTFTECARESGAARIGFVKGVASGDYDNDGRPDLYLSLYGQPNLLLRNEGPADPARGHDGPWRFSDVAARAGVREPLRSFPTFFFDYDNDGWEDLYVGGFDTRVVESTASDFLGIRQADPGARPRLYHNNRDGTFRDVTRAMGLDRALYGMGLSFGDLDNDGWLDFFIGTGDPDLGSLVPNRMFRNAGGRRFQDVTTSGGFGNLQKGHGISFADLDNDGDQDIHEDMGGQTPCDTAFNTLFLNPGHGSAWLKLLLEGTRSNRGGIGARVTVSVHESGRPREIRRTVGHGASFGGNPIRLEIGLGRAPLLRRVEVYWPASGLRQRFDGLSPGRCYRLTEGDPVPREVPLRRIPLGLP